MVAGLTILKRKKERKHQWKAIKRKKYCQAQIEKMKRLERGSWAKQNRWKRRNGKDRQTDRKRVSSSFALAVHFLLQVSFLLSITCYLCFNSCSGYASENTHLGKRVFKNCRGLLCKVIFFYQVVH